MSYNSLYAESMQPLINLLLSSLAVLIAAYLLPGVQVQNFLTAIVVAVVLGVINAIIKPILVILTLPINIVTLGLFIFVINGLLVLLASAIIPGFKVNGLGWAILFSIVLSLVSWVISAFI
jgi:putative membrane protein